MHLFYIRITHERVHYCHECIFVFAPFGMPLSVCLFSRKVRGKSFSSIVNSKLSMAPCSQKEQCADMIHTNNSQLQHVFLHTFDCPKTIIAIIIFNLRDIRLQLSRYLTSIIAIFRVDYRDVFICPSEGFGKCYRTCLDICMLLCCYSSLVLVGKQQCFLRFHHAFESSIIQGFWGLKA